MGQTNLVELLIECPWCKDISAKGRLSPACYLNLEKGTYYCHRCHVTGRAEELDLDNLNVHEVKEDKAFDPKVWEALSTDSPQLISYIKKRFNNLKGIKEADLRYDPKRHALAIPIRDLRGDVVGIKYRFIAPVGSLKYISEPGSELEGYWLDGDDKKCLIFESELDALAAKLLGFKGTALSGHGCEFSLSAESKKKLQAFKYVFVCPDNDKAGKTLIAKVKALVLEEKIQVITLPFDVKDLGELVQKDIELARSFITQQTRSPVETATIDLDGCVDEMVSYLSVERNTKGDSTGWPHIDEQLGGGLRPNEMTVINSFAKSGKTSFVNNLIHNLAKMGKKIGLASFEMDPAKMIYPTLLSMAGGQNLRAIHNSQALREVIKLIYTECDYLKNILMFKKFGGTSWSDMEEWARLLKQTHNIEYLVIDHVGFLAKKMTDAEENQILAQNIKRLTNELNLHILAVVQAPKTKDGLSIQTAYGGLAWGMNTDNFFIVERVKGEGNENQLKVSLEAARYPGANPTSKSTILFYNRETLTLSE